MGKRYAIVGGDAAGMSAATQIRRLDPQGEIVVWEKEGVISYAQCGLPYYVGGVVPAPERLLARTADEFRERYRIDVRLHHEVLAIDPREKRVRILRRDTGHEIEEGYDVLLLATGSAAVLPPWEGIDLPGVFPLKTLADAERLIAWLSRRNPERAVIVGGGYIGLEAAEALVRRGLSVTVADVAPQLIPSFDRPIAELVHRELERHGVAVRLQERVRGFSGDSAGVREVLLERGTLAADLVLVAVGVKPASELARAAGIELGPRGAVLVDEYLRTSAPDVYAAGDCATHFHRIKNAPDYVPLGTTANKQGRIAGANMAGAKIPFAGVLGTAIVKVFDLAIARTGLGEGECQALGRTCQTVAIQARPVSHYYPGAEDTLTLRITFDPQTRVLLGGQIAGRRGVDKRIDVLATALYASLTIDELQALDLAYAPPFNGVWDPLQQAATVAQKKA
ncbi:MAG: NADH dehydrogenase [Brockia lithotrophica]|uniref:NADH dehydrogenase n=1 Tax=Brockia lithotrophica TaxID=933949 RepID=A0A2T5GA88_9BACL|nr:MAG: NADH dehydrogenase [Brockia lithotrophica]